MSAVIRSRVRRLSVVVVAVRDVRLLVLEEGSLDSDSGHALVAPTSPCPCPCVVRGPTLTPVLFFELSSTCNPSHAGSPPGCRRRGRLASRCCGSPLDEEQRRTTTAAAAVSWRCRDSRRAPHRLPSLAVPTTRQTTMRSAAIWWKSERRRRRRHTTPSTAASSAATSTTASSSSTRRSRPSSAPIRSPLPSTASSHSFPASSSNSFDAMPTAFSCSSPSYSKSLTFPLQDVTPP